MSRVRDQRAATRLNANHARTVNSAKMGSGLATTPSHPFEVNAPAVAGSLPNRLLTAFEVAEFVGCHEETVGRARMACQP